MRPRSAAFTRRRGSFTSRPRMRTVTSSFTCAFHCERRERVRLRDILRLGTAMASTPLYSAKTLGVGLGALRLGVTLTELLHPAGGVEDLLLAGVEGVGGRRDVDVDHGVGVAILPFDGVRRGDRGLGENGEVRRDVTEHNRLVLRMDVLLHIDFLYRVNTCGRQAPGAELGESQEHGAGTRSYSFNLDDTTGPAPACACPAGGQRGGIGHLCPLHNTSPYPDVPPGWQEGNNCFHGPK